jgi:hypothetical protein
MILSSALPHCGAGLEAAREVQNRYAEEAIMHQIIRCNASCCLGGRFSFPIVIKDPSVNNNHEHHFESLG